MDYHSAVAQAAQASPTDFRVGDTVILWASGLETGLKLISRCPICRVCLRNVRCRFLRRSRLIRGEWRLPTSLLLFEHGIYQYIRTGLRALGWPRSRQRQYGEGIPDTTLGGYIVACDPFSGLEDCEHWLRIAIPTYSAPMLFLERATAPDSACQLKNRWIGSVWNVGLHAKASFPAIGCINSCRVYFSISTQRLDSGKRLDSAERGRAFSQHQSRFQRDSSQE